MCPVLNYTYTEGFLRTVVRLLFALWQVVLLFFPMTAAGSLVSPTSEKAKIITDLFLTPPKLSWPRDAIGSCYLCCF